jgi:hypothetical protein
MLALAAIQVSNILNPTCLNFLVHSLRYWIPHIKERRVVTVMLEPLKAESTAAADIVD